MLGRIARAPQWLLLAMIGWNLATSAWGWRAPRPAPAGARRRRFRIVIPAHDEATVIDSVLGDLAALTYPTDRFEVWVLADRCSDDTAERARRAGARVVERHEGPRGKGANIGDHLRAVPLADDEAVVVIDADNRVPPELLSRMSDELDAGHEVVQAYLDVTNPDESMLATASALTYWAGNRMVQQARHALGWSADLGGTGMCLTSSALAAAGGFDGGLTEDADLQVRIVMAGGRVAWMHDVRIRDEKPVGVDVAVKQRARWMAGKRSVARRSVGPLLARSVEERSLAPADAALRLVQPGRSFVAMVTAAMAIVACGVGRRWTVAPRVWLIATVTQLVAPLGFLLRDRIPGRYLVRYPLVTLIAALWIPIRLASRTVDGWYHTPHVGGS